MVLLPLLYVLVSIRGTSFDLPHDQTPVLSYGARVGSERGPSTEDSPKTLGVFSALPQTLVVLLLFF